LEAPLRILAFLVADSSGAPQGTRLVVRGQIQDVAAEIELVCRFLPSGLLRTITVSAVKVSGLPD
jgi:hypothetical protein